MRTLSAFFLLFCVTLFASDRWRDEGILYLDHTPHVVMHPVPVHAVEIRQGFWYKRREANLERSLPTMLELLKAHGIVENFENVAAHKNVPHHGPLFTDSDIYKWMEAAAWVLQSGDRPELRQQIDSLTKIIASAQEPNGYLNTYWSGERANERFTQMWRGHELYCLGHLLQAGIAYYRSTGNRNLLNIGVKFTDYLVSDFGPAKRPLLTGHPELEMALVELYRTTGEHKYLDLAGYLLSGVETERLHLTPAQTAYMFSGIPFTSRTEFEGHAVRAMYASSGGTDYYSETGDAAYWKTLQTLWSDLTTHKMYITGGVGSRASGESFGNAYELPNEEAYGESCAAIGNMMWNYRMLQVTGDSKYADVMERALYNGINSGVSLSGTLYCYRNPLASNGEKIRNPWYDTTCCPPNIERTLGKLPGYFYSTSQDGIYVHFFHNSVLNWHLENGTGLKITQETNYPWTGEVTLAIQPAKAEKFTVHVRVPGWSHETTLEVNGKAQPSPDTGKYVAIAREWRPGDRITLHFGMQPELMVANPRVESDYGKISLERGPLVYCIEQPDQQAPVEDLAFTDVHGDFQSENRDDLLQGIVMLKHAGLAFDPPLATLPLYQRLAMAEKRGTKPVKLSFIPYYSWANRGPQAMRVWIPER